MLIINDRRNLDDGTHIVHPAKYALLSEDSTNDKAKFIPAHASFRVVTIAAPVPPYPGFPLDPPFRSRFQARYIDNAGAMAALEGRNPLIHSKDSLSSKFAEKLRTIILTAQYASETQNSIGSIAPSNAVLPSFPQTTLTKLKRLIDAFPLDGVDGEPPLTPTQLARLVSTLHPGLLTAPFRAWAALSNQTEEAGLGPLGSPSQSVIEDDASGLDDVEASAGLLGYHAIGISRISERTASITFERQGKIVSHIVPTGSGELLPFPLPSGTTLDGTVGGDIDATQRLLVTSRFLSSLTMLLQAHALGTALTPENHSGSLRRGLDISLIPPIVPFSASCSTSTLVHVFSSILGYTETREDVYLYKELGGRELLMRREIIEEANGSKNIGATVWKPRSVGYPIFARNVVVV